MHIYVGLERLKELGKSWSLFLFAFVFDFVVDIDLPVLFLDSVTGPDIVISSDHDSEVCLPAAVSCISHVPTLPFPRTLVYNLLQKYLFR